LVQCAEPASYCFIFGEGEQVFRRVFHGSVENKFAVEKLWEKKNAAGEQPQEKCHNSRQGWNESVMRFRAGSLVVKLRAVEQASSGQAEPRITAACAVDSYPRTGHTERALGEIQRE
jgi:hypothetical protein